MALPTSRWGLCKYIKKKISLADLTLHERSFVIWFTLYCVFCWYVWWRHCFTDLFIGLWRWAVLKLSCVISRERVSQRHNNETLSRCVQSLKTEMSCSSAFPVLMVLQLLDPACIISIIFPAFDLGLFVLCLCLELGQTSRTTNSSGGWSNNSSAAWEGDSWFYFSRWTTKKTHRVESNAFVKLRLFWA